MGIEKIITIRKKNAWGMPPDPMGDPAYGRCPQAEVQLYAPALQKLGGGALGFSVFRF